MFSKLQQNIPKSVLYQKGPRQHEKDFRPNILTLPLVQAYDEEIVKPKNEKNSFLKICTHRARIDEIEKSRAEAFHMREEIIAQYIRTVTEKMPKEFQGSGSKMYFFKFHITEF